MTTTPNPAASLDDRRLRELVAGVFALPTVLVAHELRLFSLLAEEPQSSSEIASALGLPPRSADALLSVCAAAGLLEARAGRYALLPLAREFFLPESPVHFGGYWDLMIEFCDLHSFRSIRQAILGGEPPAPRLGFADGRRAGEEERGCALTRAMHDRGAVAARVWPRLVDLSRHRVLLDVGGGSGVHAIGAVRQWPHLRALVFDRPRVCALAEELVRAAGLSQSITTHAGDYEASDPFPEADLHLYSEVFHNRSLEQCHALARKSFRALPAGGRIMLHEMLLDDDRGGPLVAAAAGINMLLWTRAGRQHSRSELTEILGEAGFVDVEAVPACGYFTLLTASKPGAALAGAEP